MTPCNVAHKAPLSMEFSRQEHWSRLPFPSPGHLPYPGIKPGCRQILYHLSYQGSLALLGLCKHFLNLLHCFPEILDHLHYHYSEFFFWKVHYLHVISTHSPTPGLLSCLFICDITFCFFIVTYVIFVLATVRLCFSLLLLSAF